MAGARDADTDDLYLAAKIETPLDLFGDLFAAVQESAVFPDSKTFADAAPKSAPAAILTAWKRERPEGQAALAAFVATHFDLPTPPAAPREHDASLSDHIAALWPKLTREAVAVPAGGSLISLPAPYVVPGGRFDELYYWDSYFTILGLVRSNRQDAVDAMIADFGSLLDRFGHIPNASRSYYLSRSHPPVFYLMAELAGDRSDAARRQRLVWMRREHGYWMAGADDLLPGEAHRRVVRLADGALLNRHWDDRATPREESWREDVALAAGFPPRERPRLWRDLRAAAESGWDFSSRWLSDRASLATIRTTRIVPIDLNCLMHGLETAIAREADTAGDDETAREFAEKAARRCDAIATHMWHAENAVYADYDLDSGSASEQVTAAAAFALFAGIASAERARGVATALASLLEPGGLMATRERSGQQWDAPNGWAPLQWVAAAGLARYGEHDLARRIGTRWVSLVARHFAATGQLLEKYDVVNCAAGSGGEYETEIGFGWTNGVTLELIGTGLVDAAGG